MNIKIRRPYQFNDSLERIDRILDGYVKGEGFSQDIKKAKPDLPQNTGARVEGTVLIITFFAEGDAKLINKLKVYRAFSSEAISILSANEDCEDIHTSGNRIIAFFNTPFKKKIEKAVDNAASICSLADVINKKARNSGYPTIKVSTGLAFGDMLMMRFSTYDNLDKRQPEEVQYISPIISKAEMLCNRGFEAVKSRLYISDSIFNNLSLDYKKFFHKLDDQGTSYGADLHNVAMNNWLCK